MNALLSATEGAFVPDLLTDLSAWRGLATPVRVGPASPGTITVCQLGTRPGYERITSGVPGPGVTRRSRQLRPLHLAIQAVMQLVARPVFTDGAWIDATARQLGLTVDPHGQTLELWLDADAGARPCPAAAAIGARLGGLVAQPASTVTLSSGIGERAVTTIAAESAIAALYRTARSARYPGHEAWLGEASAALAATLGTHISAARLRCQPDTGPAVVLPARRLCCVLSPRASADSCPGCPKAGTRSDQVSHATERLAAMGDDEFVDAVGRRRMTARSTVT